MTQIVCCHRKTTFSRKIKIVIAVVVLVQVVAVWLFFNIPQRVTPHIISFRMNSAMPFNNSPHHLVTTTTMDPHAGHDMSGGMDHSAHAGMDHSAHAGMDHSAHAGMDHSAHGAGGHSGHDGMMMYFHISSKATILFEGWQTHDWQGMLGSCIAIFIMAALYEGLKVAREHLLMKYACATALYESHLNGGPSADASEVMMAQPRKLSVGTRMCSLSHLIQTLMHIVQVVVSYFLMLIFMTYNFYLCVALAMGAGTGYFLFSWKRSTIVDVNEHCH